MPEPGRAAGVIPRPVVARREHPHRQQQPDADDVEQAEDEVVNIDALDTAVANMTAHLLKGGPQALAAAKKLIMDVSRRPMDDALSAETARRIAAIRVEAEGQEGLAAFFDKRAPAWSKKS